MGKSVQSERERNVAPLSAVLSSQSLTPANCWNLIAIINSLESNKVSTGEDSDFLPPSVMETRLVCCAIEVSLTLAD